MSPRWDERHGVAFISKLAKLEDPSAKQDVRLPFISLVSIVAFCIQSYRFTSSGFYFPMSSPLAPAPRPLPAESPPRPAPFWPEGWWRWMERRIGVIPLPVYVLLLAITVGFLALGKLPTEISMVMAILALAGFTSATLGQRVPLLKHVGGPIIFATFIPSYLSFHQLIPAPVIKTVADFTNSTKMLYLFIAAICVGSILAMDRHVLVRGFLKIFIPLTIGSLAALAVGTAVGAALGLGAKYALFYIVIPIMAGGVGEGAIPLSIGYSELNGTSQGEEFARVLPPVMFGSLVAVVLSGLLNFIGKKYPHLTGEGRLQPADHGLADTVSEPAVPHPIDMTGIAAAGMLILALYLLGLILYHFTKLPAPIGMLFLAVFVKLGRVAPPGMQEDARVVYKFFTTALTFPVLFAVGITFLPWDKLVAALAWKNLITIVATVATLMITGFFVGRWVKLYPIEAAIVNACHSGQGSSGDVAILTAANRLQLMPFAQISTRIGGAITVTAALIALARWAA
jgi:CCS family citrate carrier protein